MAFLFVGIVGYTAIVISNHGLGRLWLAWRHHFSPAGLALGVLGFLAGAPVLTAYLFVASLQAKGDPAELFLGSERARRA